MQATLVPPATHEGRPTSAATPERPTPEAGPAPRDAVLRRLVILIALYAFPSVVVMRPVTDPDIWWHLRAGQWVVEHRAVPATDPFSSFGQGRPWVAYSWLYEVVVYGLYRGLGLYGVVLYRAGLTFAVALAVHRLVARREARFGVAAGLVGAALVALAALMAERPWLVTILFTALTLDVILDLRAGRGNRLAWVLPGLFAVWANVHIQFIHGLFLLALACVAPLADQALGRPGAGGSAADAGAPGWWRLVALSGACLAATLLNPYGGRLYAVVVEYATQPVAYDLVAEHTAMAFREPGNWAVLALIVAAGYALGRRPRPSALDWALLASAAYFGFHSARDAWFTVLGSLAVLVAAPRPPVSAEDRFSVTWPRAALAAATVSLVLLAAGWARLSPARLEREVEDHYPAQAAAVIERRGYEGPLFNHFDWGGYLIWRLPHLPVALDGRTNLHGDPRLRRALDTWGGRAGWDWDPELSAAKLVIADARDTLASLLRLDPRFELVHEDRVAAVFVARRSAAEREGDHPPGDARQQCERITSRGEHGGH